MAIDEGTPFGLEVDHSGPTLTVYLWGDLDAAHAPTLEPRVTASLARATTNLVLDVAAVTFCDSFGLRSFVALNDVATARNISLRIQDPTRSLRRLFLVTGLDQVLSIYGTAT